MKKILIIVLTVIVISSCGAARTTPYVVNDIPVERIDGHEYFVIRDAEGNVTSVERKPKRGEKAWAPITAISALLIALFGGFAGVLRR